MSSPGPDVRLLDMQQALEEGERRLAELPLTTRALTRIRLRSLKKRDPAAALTSLSKIRDELRSVERILDDIYQRGRRAEAAEALAEPLGPAWLADVERRLAETPTSEGRTALWLDAWSQALAADRLGRAQDLAVLPAPMAGEPDLHELVGTISAGLDPPWTSELAAAVRTMGTAERVPPATRVRMLVLRSRYLRRFGDDSAGALECAESAVRASRHASADPALTALAKVSVAEAYLALGRIDDSGYLLGDPLDPDEAGCDRLIAAGRLAAAQADYAQADECYGAAAARFPDEAGRSCLLREVPGNLLWALARVAANREDDEALTLYDRAVEAGMVGNSEYAERRALWDKAVLLELRGRLPEAAAAYRAAADRYSAIGSDRAIELYRKAYRNDPDNAEYCWLYGESLRFSAVDIDEVVHRERMAEALAVLEEGLRKADPTAEQAWVFGSAALAADALDGTADSELLLERALLLDPGYTLGYAFLSVLLRRHGFLAEAVEAAEQGMALDRSVEFLTAQHLWTLMDVGRYDEVIDCAAEHLASWPGSQPVLLAQGTAYLRLGNLDAALTAFADPGLDEETRHFALGVGYSHLGAAEAERREFQALWDRGDAVRSRSTLGWAGYRLGLVSEAIAIMAELHQLAPQHPLRAADLGQALLSRGDPAGDDVERGAALLLGAIDAHCLADELRHIDTVELPLLRAAVTAKPHQEAVSAVLDQAAVRIEQRVEELLRRRRPEEKIPVRLARARRPGADPEEALRTYTDPVIAAAVPETAAAASRIVAEQAAAADALLADGDLPGARRRWLELHAQAERLPALSAERAALRARLGLSTLELAGPGDPEAAKWLAGSDASALEEAFDRFARTPATAWTHQDGLRAVAADPALPAADRAALLGCAEQLPYERLFRTSRTRIPAQDVTPLTRPIGLALGPAHAALIGMPEFTSGFPPLREGILQRTGVRIPGVKVYLDTSLPAEGIRETVHERTAGEASVLPGDGAVAAIMRHFEQALLPHLFRWIGVDDVELWAAGWSAAEDSDGDPWLPPDPVDRVRLARVLRALLVEEVPIGDRDAILEAFRAAGPASLATTLRTVRRRLDPAVLTGGAGAEPVPLERGLQDRIAAGLSESAPGTWELPRDQVRALVADLSAWRKQQAAAGVQVISVDDGRVRPFAWRLLAAERPLLPVVGTDELP
ncbi:FHIPEP family type III secretion protein [Jatrophihabitans sp.]|uniref:FHIPEP family type III secretion protein n=1 Tax=Jatrophihabitans sp. TaxID=1932789 RepID=UPI002CC9E589|nr:FHIPEP family type III secretion protein [Jatrophihabitans sp.]